MKYNLIILIAFFLVTSCEEVEDKIKGIWYIEEVEINEVGIDLFENFQTNSFIFRINDQNSVELPVRRIENLTFEHYFQKGTWEILNENDKQFLLIKGAADDFFNCKFELSLSTRMEGLEVLIMELQSEKIYIKSVKAE